MSKWNSFPHTNSDYLYDGQRLRESWPDLHRGDRVEFPDADWVERTLEQAPEAAPGDFDGDYDALASLIVALASPLLGAVADRIGGRKGFLCVFAFTGVMATGLIDR